MNIGRNAVLAAGWPESVPATTIDRQCGSSQQAMHFAAQGVMAGAYDIVVAGGVESMSRVPMGVSTPGQDPQGPVSPGATRKGWSARASRPSSSPPKWGLSRERLDEYSARSHRSPPRPRRRRVRPTRSCRWTSARPRRAARRDETIRPATSAGGLAALKPSFEDAAACASGSRDRTGGSPPGNSSPLTDTCKRQ